MTNRGDQLQGRQLQLAHILHEEGGDAHGAGMQHGGVRERGARQQLGQQRHALVLPAVQLVDALLLVEGAVAVARTLLTLVA